MRKWARNKQGRNEHDLHSRQNRYVYKETQYILWYIIYHNIYSIYSILCTKVDKQETDVSDMCSRQQLADFCIHAAHANIVPKCKQHLQKTCLQEPFSRALQHGISIYWNLLQDSLVDEDIADENHHCILATFKDFESCKNNYVSNVCSWHINNMAHFCPSVIQGICVSWGHRKHCKFSVKYRELCTSGTAFNAAYAVQ